MELLRPLFPLVLGLRLLGVTLSNLDTNTAGFPGKMALSLA
jgi:hypothetical protein